MTKNKEYIDLINIMDFRGFSIGKAIMSALKCLNIELYNEIKGTELDCSIHEENRERTIAEINKREQVSIKLLK